MIDRLHYLFDLGLFKTLKNEKEYKIRKYLGQGAYGIGFEVSYGNSSYAAKIQLLKEVKVNYLAELQVYEKLSHYPGCDSHLVCLYDHFIVDNLMHSGASGVLILELMDGILFNILPKIKAKDVLTLMIDVLSALNLLHSNGISHGDVSLVNIFYKRSDKEYIFKLGDFGLSKAKAEEEEIKRDNQAFAEILDTIVYNKVNKIDFKEIGIKLEVVEKIIEGLEKGTRTADQTLNYLLQNI